VVTIVTLRGGIDQNTHIPEVSSARGGADQNAESQSPPKKETNAYIASLYRQMYETSDEAVGSSNFPSLSDNGVLVEVASNESPAELHLRPILEDAGCEVTDCAEYFCSSYIPLQLLPNLESLDQVRWIRPSLPIVDSNLGRQGSVANDAYFAHLLDAVHEKYPDLDGRGLKIGILSDSYNRQGGESNGIRTGDLPGNVQILKEYRATAGDEGRAMAELIYDLVPRAQLIFRTAFEGSADFARGIEDLADAGCDVIVDDIGMF